MAWFKDWFSTPYYHLLYGERDEKEAGRFISELIQSLKPVSEAVFLDLACGKGRHAFDIASHGYKVFGVDLSKESISEAAQKSSDRLHFEVHDMRKPYKQAYFDYVLNLFTSFGYFEDPDDNLKTLKAVHHDLRSGGVFVQDYFNVEKVKAGIVPLEIKTKGGIDFEIRKELSDTCIIKTISFKDNGIHYNFQEKVSLLNLSDFQNLYRQSGLEIMYLYGDYSLSPFDPQKSDRLILISKKHD